MAGPVVGDGGRSALAVHTVVEDHVSRFRHGGLAMASVVARRFTATIVGGVGALAGFIAASIVIFNLHTIVGLEEGYGSTPQQVLDHSIVLAVADIGLLGAGIVGGVLAGLWMRRSWHWEGTGNTS